MILRKYDWAVSPLKLARALDKTGPEAPEYLIQKEYIALGGKVLGELLEAPKPVEAPKEVPIINKTPDVSTPEAPVQTRRGRPKSDK